MAFPVPLDNELSEAITKDLPPAEYYVPDPTLSIWQRFLGQEKEQQLKRVQRMLNGAAVSMGRHPTQQEVDAICEISYKETRTVAWVMPAALAFAGVMTWKGRASYNFPFYRPNFVKFNPELFPSSRAPFLAGKPASITWHHVRFVSYGILGGIGLTPLLGSYAASVAITTAARDDRLSQFRKDMNPGRVVSMAAEQLPLSNLRAQREKLVHSIYTAEQALQSKQMRLSMAKTEARVAEITTEIDRMKTRLLEYKLVLEKLDEVIARKSSQSFESKDASPNQDYAALSASSSAEYQGPQSSSRPVYSTPSETSSPQSGWGQQSSTSQSDWGQADASDGLDIDDASPVAPAARSPPQSSSPTSTGSAWERLRQSAQRQQRPSGGAWEGFEGRQGQSGDSEVESDKDKAQREFDEMLERERSTDDQESGRNSRW